FTETAIGTTIPTEGAVSICPVCDRPGILETLPDGRYEFVHVESEELLGDGILVTPVDACAIPA
ncbi:MAG TPA: hypothetical protein VFL12_11860, partial [Thermoanaerobaculia bacterium]|nr:hypothetical protein [Thermoanaerobaculia bacterium]